MTTNYIQVHSCCLFRVCLKYGHAFFFLFQLRPYPEFICVRCGCCGHYHDCGLHGGSDLDLHLRDVSCGGAFHVLSISDVLSSRDLWVLVAWGFQVKFLLVFFGWGFAKASCNLEMRIPSSISNEKGFAFQDYILDWQFKDKRSYSSSLCVQNGRSLHEYFEIQNTKLQTMNAATNYPWNFSKIPRLIFSQDTGFVFRSITTLCR